jgi:hypothetical protein
VLADAHWLSDTLAGGMLAVAVVSTLGMCSNWMLSVNSARGSSTSSGSSSSSSSSSSALPRGHDGAPGHHGSAGQ